MILGGKEVGWRKREVAISHIRVYHATCRQTDKQTNKQADIPTNEQTDRSCTVCT